MDDVWKRLYVYGAYVDDPVMMATAIGGRYYYIKDRQQSVKALADAGGSVVERYDYNPFGLMTVKMNDATVDNPYGYTGRRWDSETGLWYYRNRMYSPTLGRFLQRDPLGYVDGMNLYAYVTNNPLGFIDPFGLLQEVMTVEAMEAFYVEIDNFDWMLESQGYQVQEQMNGVLTIARTPTINISFETEFYYGGTPTNNDVSNVTTSQQNDSTVVAALPQPDITFNNNINADIEGQEIPAQLPNVSLGAGSTASTIPALPGSQDLGGLVVWENATQDNVYVSHAGGFIEAITEGQSFYTLQIPQIPGTPYLSLDMACFNGV